MADSAYTGIGTADLNMQDRRELEQLKLDLQIFTYCYCRFPNSSWIKLSVEYEGAYGVIQVTDTTNNLIKCLNLLQ